MSLLPEVESALLDAVRRHQRASAHGRIVGTIRAWLRARPRGLLLIAGVLVVSGSAAAAITLSAERSAPLSSIVPAGQQPNTALVAGERYDIEIAPSIRAGNISWCSSIRTYHRSGRPDDLGTGACDDGAPTVGSPLFGVDNIDNGGGLSYVFTGPQVAAIRIAGGPTVLTRADPRLPYGYRAAVFEYKPPSGPPGDLSIPGGVSQLVTVLNSSGHAIPDDDSGPPEEATRSWLYPKAPAQGSCSLTVKPNTGLYTGSGTVVTSIVPAPQITGEAFLSCIDTDLYLPGSSSSSSSGTPTTTAAHLAVKRRMFLTTTMEAAVLVNAKHPGALPAALPGMHRVPGQPGLFDRPQAELPTVGPDSRGMTARRSGNSWLVVIGGTGTMQRVSAIHDLTVGPLQLRAAAVPPSAPARSLCDIGYQPPLAAMQEITQNAIASPRDTRQGFFNQGQRILNQAYARLRRDQARFRHDRALIARDQAALALASQALDRRTQLDTLFPPTCAIARFYYQDRWPMTATLVLATRDCPGPRSFVPCNKLRPAWRNTIARVLRPVPGQGAEFTVPANLFHPAETVKQINKWWLVVDGGESPRQQQLLLSRLTTTVAPSLRRTLRSTIATPLAFCARQNPTAC